MQREAFWKGSTTGPAHGKKNGRDAGREDEASKRKYLIKEKTS